MLAGLPHNVGTYSEDIRQQFWENVNRLDDQESCWNWAGPVHSNGYGVFNVGPRQELAHRLALELSGTEIPVGHVVMQTCGNRLCCNPAHLRAGTRSEQMAKRSRLRKLPKPDDPSDGEGDF